MTNKVLVSVRLPAQTVKRLDSLARKEAGQMGKPSRPLVLEAAINKLWQERRGKNG